MSDSDTHDEDDFALFREHVGEVNPIKNERIADPSERPAPHPRQGEADEQRVLSDMMSDEYDPSEIQPGDILSFCRPGIQKSVFGKLRRGEYKIQAELDLHGMNVAQAREAVVAFLLEVRQARMRCVRIIHGKGWRSDNQGPKLKANVNKWLRQRDEVLAFHSARPVDGGTGAVYVLIKRPGPR